MIKISIREDDRMIHFLTHGHSIGTDEPCARVTTCMDIIRIILSESLENDVKRTGFTEITVFKKRDNKTILTKFILYLESLAKNYPAHITIEMKGI